MNQSDKARVERICEILDLLRGATLSPEQVTRLEQELDRLGQVRDPNAIGLVLSEPVEVVEYRAFVERLIRRQGSIMPDFASIYRRKAAIDRNFLNDSQNDPDA
jgi:hypothetical protein